MNLERIIKVPFKEGYLQLNRDFHSLESNVREWFNKIYWTNNQTRILEKVRENSNIEMYLEIQQKAKETGIDIIIKLKREK